MKKRILATLLSFIAAFGCVGCGELPETGAPGNDGGNGDGDKTMLRISYFKGGYGSEWLEALEAAFEAEHPDVDVDLTGDSLMESKIPNIVAAKNGTADIVFGLRGWQKFVAKGQVEPITDIYSSTIGDKTLRETFVEEMRDFGKVGEDYYAIPWNDGVCSLVYNEKMFIENNWAVPTTFDELMDLMPKIKAIGVAPIAWGGQVSHYWNLILNVWWAQYEGMENYKKFFKLQSPSVFEQEGRLKALEAFEELLCEDTSNSILDPEGKDHTESQIEFLNGRAAMIPCGNWMKNEIKDSIPEGFSMKMMQLPVIDGAKETKVNWTNSGDYGIIPKNAKQKDLAKEFLKFMHREENLLLYTEKTGAPRPCVYDPSEAKNLSPYDEGVIEIWKESKNIYFGGDTHSAYMTGAINEWPGNGGAPFLSMFSGSLSAYDAYKKDIDYVNAFWDDLVNG